MFNIEKPGPGPGPGPALHADPPCADVCSGWEGVLLVSGEGKGREEGDCDVTPKGYSVCTYRHRESLVVVFFPEGSRRLEGRGFRGVRGREREDGPVMSCSRRFPIRFSI